MEPLRGGSIAGEVPAAVEEIWNEAPVKRTAAEWGLRWVWNHPEVTVVLSGMNDESHIEENLKIASDAQPNTLTETELALVARAEKKYRELMKAGCTGCSYCMPCPVGVDIPTCLELYNNLHMFDNDDMTKLMYAARLSGVLSGARPAFASQCVQCNKCVEKCPQHLDIPALLESVVEELEGPSLEERIGMAKMFLANKDI
jgi:predicted aldo/keto reductase-like oxidoreductase